MNHSAFLKLIREARTDPGQEEGAPEGSGSMGLGAGAPYLGLEGRAWARQGGVMPARKGPAQSEGVGRPVQETVLVVREGGSDGLQCGR